jgi:hypothetical protein
MPPHLAGLGEIRRPSVDQRTGLTNELRSVLQAYFPQALDLVGERLDSPMALDFLERWPDLIRLQAARPATLKAFYYRHNVRRPEAVPERPELVRPAQARTTDEMIVTLAIRQVRRLLQQVRALPEHMAEDEKLIPEAFRPRPEAARLK